MKLFFINFHLLRIFQIIQWTAIIIGSLGTLHSIYMYFKLKRTTTVLNIKDNEENSNQVKSIYTHNEHKGSFL